VAVLGTVFFWWAIIVLVWLGLRRLFRRGSPLDERRQFPE
jgi:hypothetical protein